ncbi:MAG: OmpA family protein [Chitinophagaceae bacterium]|nr:OmpA family protein [Chitinophagaceae bacterium]
MIKRPVLFLLASCLLFNVASAQKFSSKKKGNLIGFGFNVVDFKTPAEIKATSLGDVLKQNDWKSFNNKDVGISLMYWKGLTNNIDFSARYNGLFTSNANDNIKRTGDAYSNEFEGALHAKALSDDHLFNPFLTAGLGIGNYGSKWGGYAPLGLGVQANLMSSAYLFLQAHYRLSFSKSNLKNNLFYSFGVADNLSKPKDAPVLKEVPIPIVEPKDTDGDGVVDTEDACPDVAGLASLKGCPDGDGDGIADKDDKCPDVAGVAKYNGCPVPDTDGDGVNDEEDKCPSVPGLARYNGCPIPDTDGDGVNDEEDKCPSVPGIAANNGCPEIKKEVVAKVQKAAGQIFFATGKDVLLKKSHIQLNEVVKLLEEDPTLKLDIAGHTDDVGAEDFNQVLSEKRANAVRNYIVGKGISEDRITASGYGEAQPIADNKTAAGRAKNRRVELELRNW